MKRLSNTERSWCTLADKPTGYCFNLIGFRKGIDKGI